MRTHREIHEDFRKDSVLYPIHIQDPDTANLRPADLYVRSRQRLRCVESTPRKPHGRRQATSGAKRTTSAMEVKKWPEDQGSRGKRNPSVAGVRARSAERT